MKLSTKLFLLNLGPLLSVGAVTVYGLNVSGSKVSTSFYMIFGATIFIGACVGYWVSTKISAQLLDVSKKISSGSIDFRGEIKKVSSHASDLFSATASQASSLQQTVASLNEISAMVDKNTEASQSSQELSEKSREAAEVGKGTIGRMISSIDDIGDANLEIVSQMTKNAQEIQEIITVIREIESKTKVINDIVFQTKLLSFNASVEAARAGEHGKGFSVVAEEVGNLAQHSGDAAKQIEEMLNQSIAKVESIANNTESKVKTLIKSGSEKVDQGRGIAKECDTALGDILDYAQKLDTMIEEIATASVEQSQGVQEISRAMSELDKVTKQNSVIAQETSNNTDALNTQVEKLESTSKVLQIMITGGDSQVVKNHKMLEPKKEHTKNLIKEKPSNVLPMKKPVEKVVAKKEHASVKHISVKATKSSVVNAIPIADEGEWEDI